MDTQLELLKEKWDKILESIRDDNELSNVAFKTWLLPLKVFRIEGNILKITAPFEQAATRSGSSQKMRPSKKNH